MKTPPQITKEIIDEMIPIWEELAEKGWDGCVPFNGLCQHAQEAMGTGLMNLMDNPLYKFIEKEFGKYFIKESGRKSYWIQPDSGKEGAQKRVEILKQIRKELK